MWRPALSLCLTIVLCGTTAFAAPPAATPAPAATVSPSPAPADPVDALPPADLSRALDFIRKNYVAPAALDEAALKRATLAGLLDRLGPGLSLSTAAAPNESPAPAPFYHEILAGHIGYLRPGALRKNDLTDLDGELKDFAAKKVDALILDLRATGRGSDFAAAAEFAKRFVPRGEELFAMHGPDSAENRIFTSDRSPAYSGFLTVLIDEETIGGAEALASVLRARDKAILIGHATGGGAVSYAELPLSKGLVLRVAATEAVLPEQSATFPHRVEPEIPVAQPLETKHEIFAQSLTKGMAPFVFEEDRPHLNEAALLAGTNPEIEAMKERQQRRARGDKPPLRDAVTQRAVDIITSIGVYTKQARPTP
jgi:peptidase S41-like protein